MVNSAWPGRGDLSDSETPAARGTPHKGSLVLDFRDDLRSTLAFWAGYAAAEVAPVVARLREILLASARLFADETVVPVLDPGRGRTKQGHFWAIARDDRPWGGTDPPAAAYTYAPGRGHIHAKALLGGYRGILQCDGYTAYKQLANGRENAVTLAFCWSHVRRGFYDLAKTCAAPIGVGAHAGLKGLVGCAATSSVLAVPMPLACRSTERVNG
jgi:hypothetical protein